MTATLPHSSWAISWALRGSVSISRRIRSARRLCMRKRSSISADVVGDRPAVAAERELELQLARLLERVHVGDERLRARPVVVGAERPAGAPAAGWRRCARSGGPPPAACRRRSSRKTVSEGLCPGRWSTRSVRSRSASSEPSLSGLVTSTGAPQPRKLADTARSAVDDFCGDAVAQHQALREAVFEVRLAPEAARERARAPRAPRPRRPSGARGSMRARNGRCAGGSRSAARCPRRGGRVPPSARSSSSSAFAEFGPESTSVSGESSIR